jgi:hypothetical protein
MMPLNGLKRKNGERRRPDLSPTHYEQRFVDRYTGRKSVQEGKADRIADLLEEAANEIERLRNERTN